MLTTSRGSNTELRTSGQSSGLFASGSIQRQSTEAELRHVRYWNRRVGRPLVHLLRTHAYSSSQIARFKQFFASHVSKALGERFDHRMGHKGSHWTSLMCDDGSPVEIGLAWKAKNKTENAQVRFAIEPVDDDEVRQLGSNLGATHTLVRRLTQSGHLSQQGARLFRRVDQAVTDCLDSNKASTTKRTRYMVGFDVLRPETATAPLVQTKAYFVLPGLCSSPDAQQCDEPEAQLQTILEAISDVAPSPGFKQLKSYLQTLPSAQRGRPIILSVDLDATGNGKLRTRVKVYWRFPDAAPQSVASHMCLGGEWNRPVDVALTARSAWTNLMATHCPSQTAPTDDDHWDVPRVDPFTSTGGSLFYFDLSWCSAADEGAGKPAPSKAYVPVRHLLPPVTGINQASDDDCIELEIARRCVRMLEEAGRSGSSEAYLDSLIPFCRHKSGDANLFGSSPIVGTHTYVCAEGEPSKPDICVYLKPPLGAF